MINELILIQLNMELLKNCILRYTIIKYIKKHYNNFIYKYLEITIIIQIILRNYDFLKIQYYSIKYITKYI